MKILAHTINPAGTARVQVQHGIWPLCFYREYYGRDDQWKFDKVQGCTFVYRAAPRVRAALTRFYVALAS